MSVAVRIKGLPRINRVLKKLSAAEGKKAIRKGMRAAIKPLTARAKALAPVASGLTRQAVKVRAARSRGGSIGLRVGIGKGNYQGHTFYGAFQEFGWKAGSRSRGSARPQIPGKHFMERAFRETGESVRADAERQILAELLKAAR